MTQHALLVEVLEGFHKQNETRNFNNISRRSASLQEPQISQKNLRKSDPPKYWKTFRETLGRGNPQIIFSDRGLKFGSPR